MARRRYISTEISIDKDVNKLVSKIGPMAALLYTWMIPHAEDNRSITSDPEEILFSVIPGIRTIVTEDVSKYIDSMIEIGLLQRLEGKLYFPESFYKYQSYIPESKRNYDAVAPITEEHRTIPQNTASPSPSPSPSPSLTLMGEIGSEEPVDSPKKNTIRDRFDEFWANYPKKRSKGDAEKAWTKIKPNEQLHNRILQSLEQAKTSADWTKNNGQYIPYPASWLNAKGWEDELEPESKKEDTRRIVRSEADVSRLRE